MSLAQEVLAGSRLALARLLTQIENETPEGRRALNELYPHTGNAHLIGVTGAPGTGKSSLVNQLAIHYRRQEGEDDERVAILAVDPSSPFTGGAILGDRVRMRDLSGDTGVFIRSMASRGSIGGLAVATSAMTTAFNAAGYRRIIIETVGAGQSEVDIARLAHTTLVVEAPGLGDDIQAIKAGILEIADILVINKADRPGVESTERALKSNLQLGHPMAHIFQNGAGKAGHGFQAKPPVDATPADFWMPPIVKTVAVTGKGLDELIQAIAGHYQHLQSTGELERRERARLASELNVLLREALMRRWRDHVPEEKFDYTVEEILFRRLSPWQAVESLTK